MALICVGETSCPICDRVLEIGDQIVATSHFIADPKDPLWPFSDTCMHKECFLQWDQRRNFVSRFNAIFSNCSFSGGMSRHMDENGAIDGRYGFITEPRRAPEVVGQSLFRSVDEITQYIYRNYQRLMTDLEMNVYQYFCNEPIRESEYEEQEKAWHWIPTNESATNLIATEPVEFMVSVRDRILKEHSAEVCLNRCPRCNALARTPTAKQCPKCFHSWHQSA